MALPTVIDGTDSMKAKIVIKEEIDNKIRSFTEELVKLNCDIVYEFPFKTYLKYLREGIPHRAFLRAESQGNGERLFREVTINYIIKKSLNLLLSSAESLYTRRRRNWFRNIVSSYDSAILCRYNKLVLAFLMRDTLDLLPNIKLPGEVVDLYYQWFTAVLNDFDKRSDDYYSLENRAFSQDVHICCLRSIPLGGWFVQKVRIGFGLFIGVHPWQLLKYITFVLRMGGFSPFYIIHVAVRYLHIFGPEERKLSYIRIAELMKQDPSIRGVFGISWYLDPNLEKVSPHLAYLRRELQGNGARLFKGMTTGFAIRDALSKSSTRRKLYNEGKYHPTQYAYIWPRKALIKWAERATPD